MLTARAGKCTAPACPLFTWSVSPPSPAARSTVSASSPRSARSLATASARAAAPTPAPDVCRAYAGRVSEDNERDMKDEEDTGGGLSPRVGSFSCCACCAVPACSLSEVGSVAVAVQSSIPAM
eukprot:362000-Chlamydomonas_euryale.AAC.7